MICSALETFHVILSLHRIVLSIINNGCNSDEAKDVTMLVF
jgi:hypothetical protein